MPNRNSGNVIHSLVVRGVAEEKKFVARIDVGLNYQIQEGMYISLPCHESWTDGFDLVAVHVDPDKDWVLVVQFADTWEKLAETIQFAGTYDSVTSDLKSAGWSIKTLVEIKRSE